MSKISCDVNKDLLTSYLDGICSEESKGLVEEHLRECAACRQFVEQIQATDLGKDAVKVDFLKRVKQSIKIRSWIAAALALLLVLIGHPGIRYQSLDTLLFYIAMPILLLITGILALKENDNQSRALERMWVVPALGAALICVILGTQLVICGIITDKISTSFPKVEMGPLLNWVNTGFAALAVVLLVASFFRLKGRKSLCIISLNMGWLGLNLALACDTLLYHISDPPTVTGSFIEVITVLLLEFAVVTALLLIFVQIMNKRQKRIPQ